MSPVGILLNDFDLSDGAAWISAKASSYNPFLTGMKQAEQFSVDIQSKEIDLEKPRVGNKRFGDDSPDMPWTCCMITGTPKDNSVKDS